MKKIQLNKKTIGYTEPLYFIADIGANHDGDISRAYKLIELAKESGADAAKFQNFQANKIVSKFGFENLNQKLSHQSNWKKTVYEVYEDASIQMEWTVKLKEKCDKVGIEYFTSPYDYESVDFVDPYVHFYKIGSGDITWIEMIQYIAKKQKPVILATGASTMTDVERAMEALSSYTNEIVLMQCNTNYTGNPDNFRFINLNVLKTFETKFPDTILGLSDHTPGHSTVLGSIPLGARIFEKHFTDDNLREGPDHKFAMNPKTWKEMVQCANEVYLSLGDGVKKVEQNEEKSLIVQRRSIRTTKRLLPGDIITLDDLEVLRPIPEDGLAPYQITDCIGKKVTQIIESGEHVTIKNVAL